MNSADLTDRSATDLAHLIASREVKPSEVMEATLARIATVNPSVNAIVSMPDAESLMAQARAADEAPSKGWLHGIPMAVKDLLAVKGIRTTWGSPLYATYVPAADDLIPARMRAAGAIFIGKTNTPEWGHGSHSFNPVFGVTCNPYDLSRTAGGSSGGAAAALATRMVSVADGSDMMGSLRNPAAFCNVYGFRPSYGLVPSDAVGDTYLATLATEGPMARTVEDVANLLTVQAGENPQVPFALPNQPFADHLKTDLRGKRLAWLGDWGGAYPLEPGIAALCETALQTFTTLGAKVEALPPPFPAEKLWFAWTTLRAMLNSNGKRALYDDPAKRAQLKPETVWEIEQGLSLSADAVYAASEIRSRWYAHAARLFDRFDAVLMPSAQVWPFPTAWRWPAEINGQKMDTYHRWMEIVVPVSLIGLPALNIPVGFGANGLPMGMQLITRFGSDAQTLAMGHAYHMATDWPAKRPPPLG
ncbi:amidase [Gemmobacter aquarius]|uniref:Amidase n=1 Tax=Paragemmobacter aquarius TaxID=2169400 RepID=A0A2S0UJ11_9RHOB|nr:amidase [Gemmobacter aquarius]AWB47775.1 amidase [Gemmobacter aquarius]